MPDSNRLYLLTLAAGLACARPDQSKGMTTPPETVARTARASGAETALVPRFLGCYTLDLADGRPYRIRLTDTPRGPNWIAMNTEPGNPNVAGNEWHWAPLDSMRFDLEWGGIDAAMQFTVTRSASAYGATGRRFSSGPMPAGELHPTVRRVGCPRS